MKNLYIALALLISGTALGQIGHSVNKPSGSVLNPINAIDSIRFNGTQTEMQIVLTNGTVVNHAISDINNVTFTGSYPAGSIFCASGATAIVDVLNPTTGRIWMDRNLGATQVATSSTDAASYGDLYQWGRRSDGHQCSTSANTVTLSSVDQPSHGDFILTISPYDWRSPQNANLWQGVNGINNPCPSGYRLPTSAELDSERLSWSTINPAGAFASPLKLPVAGSRDAFQGLIGLTGYYGYYWGSTVTVTQGGTLSWFLQITNASAFVGGITRGTGSSVRCIKD